MADDYSLEEFVAAVKTLIDDVGEEATLLRQLAPLAERLAVQPGLAAATARLPVAENGFTFNLLHEEANHDLAVAILRWLPTAQTLPHNHGTWGVVVGISGDEKNILWQRIDDGSVAGYAELERIGEMHCRIGEAVLLPQSIIHSVENCSEAISESLHVYGKNVYFAERSHFDVVNHREIPWQITGR